MKSMRSYLALVVESNQTDLPSVLVRMCEERRKAHTEYLKNTSNAKTLETYRNEKRLVKKAIRTHKRKQLEENTQDMEEDFKKNN